MHGHANTHRTCVASLAVAAVFSESQLCLQTKNFAIQIYATKWEAAKKKNALSRFVGD